jgi:PAS domain-containing protein
MAMADWFWLGIALLLINELSNAWRLLRALRGSSSWPQGFGLIASLGRAMQRRLRRGQSQRARLVALLKMVRALGRALPDAVFVIDAEHRMVWANANAKNQFVVPNNMRGMPLHQVLRLEVLAGWLSSGQNEPLLDVGAPGNPALRLSFRVRTANCGRA